MAEELQFLDQLTQTTFKSSDYTIRKFQRWNKKAEWTAVAIAPFLSMMGIG